MECISIDNMTFSQAGRDAIEDIRRRAELFSTLSWAVPTAAIVVIFAGNKPLQSAYNITQTDFDMLARAMRALSPTGRRVVLKIAQEEYLRTSSSASTNKESKFWRGVIHGCNL